MNNIYLVGFMGTGKTTVGKFLARKMRREFIEMDRTIEKNEKQTIRNIFKAKGETYFRKLENKLLKKVSRKNKLVISCGGGVICNKENAEIMRNTGIIVNLTAPASVIWERIKKTKRRPLLDVANPLKRIQQLLRYRKPYYRKAHYFINTKNKTPQKIANEIIFIFCGEKNKNG
jgi:shikimate kinase